MSMADPRRCAAWLATELRTCEEKKPVGLFLTSASSLFKYARRVGASCAAPVGGPQ